VAKIICKPLSRQALIARTVLSLKAAPGARRVPSKSKARALIFEASNEFDMKIVYTKINNMTDKVSIFLAFAAGLLSFLSPCVLPLIPSYLGILGGMSTGDSKGRQPRLIAGTVSFIFGFSAVFVLLSILSSVFFFFIGGISQYINIAAGIIVIALGLNVIFDFLSFLNYEKRYHSKKHPAGIIGTFIAGLAFGAGWTPCIGPILTGILLLAGQQGKAGIAALYLIVYSAGLGLPFLGAAIFFDRFLAGKAWLTPRLPLIRKISGAILILTGILILSGQFTILNRLIPSRGIL
jgi:cytochrome c-type biogenesis protein